MISFEELIKKTHLINDLILSKMGCDNQEYVEDTLEFNKHLFETKAWFVRISWKKKKKFLRDLINEIQNISTMSLLLKSIWNCRPKDAILSISEYKTWSSYDQAPMDHDRTIRLSSIKDVMTNDRKWFHSLECEQQCLVLTELLSVGGGPIMWEVLKYSQQIYEQNLQQQLENLKECVVVNEPLDKKLVNVEAIKKDQTPRRKSSATQIESRQPLVSGQALKELETNLVSWASTIKSMKDSLKVEEVEMSFKDGTKKRTFKINRPKPEALETVDFIQLLPSAIGKRILLYVPLAQLSDCARVNRYWAYLVEEFRGELAARQKINVELEKLRENVFRYDVSLSLLKKPQNITFTTLHINSASGDKTRETKSLADKSYAYFLKLERNKREKRRQVGKVPFRNMADFNERLEIRGAADENIWKWCANVCKINQTGNRQEKQATERIQIFENCKFPCPGSSLSVNIPLNPPLIVDPTKNIPMKTKEKTNIRTTKEK